MSSNFCHVLSLRLIVLIHSTFIRERHRIALHHSIVGILKRYGELMALIMPDRQMFFPDANDRAHKPDWAACHFRQIWARVSNEPARPYDLRSHYAVANITRWKGLGYSIHDKLLCLSRTPGTQVIVQYILVLQSVTGSRG